MTPGLFSRVGEALYGAEWMAPLGAALDVAPRTIARWASGYSRIPPNIQFELSVLVLQRGDLLAGVRTELAAAAGERPLSEPYMPPAT